MTLIPITKKDTMRIKMVNVTSKRCETGHLTYDVHAQGSSEDTRIRTLNASIKREYLLR